MGHGRVTRLETPFRRFEHSRVHEYVAEQLRRLIALRIVTAGRSLPPERELARQYGVGRATIQRAITVIEEEGLVERRRGRRGGTFVVGADTRAAGAPIILRRLGESRDAIEDAVAFRLELEPGIAAAAAEMRTPSSLERITRACHDAAAAEDDAQFMEHDTEFHLAVAAATRNRFYVAAAEQFRVVLNDALVALPDSRLWHQRSVYEHENILAAIEMADPCAAREAMRVHAGNTGQSVRALLAALRPTA
jgi:GntR family transcriptional regulator, transcriptional repressor for pyruvate dehydrogenase complex